MENFIKIKENIHAGMFNFIFFHLDDSPRINGTCSGYTMDINVASSFKIFERCKLH